MGKFKENATRQYVTILKEELPDCFEKLKGRRDKCMLSKGRTLKRSMVSVFQVGYIFVNVKWMSHFRKNPRYMFSQMAMSLFNCLPVYPGTNGEAKFPCPSGRGGPVTSSQFCNSPGPIVELRKYGISWQ